MRDLAGFVETRQQLLTLKPNHRMNWIGFAVSHHLNSEYDSFLPTHIQMPINFLQWDVYSPNGCCSISWLCTRPISACMDNFSIRNDPEDSTTIFKYRLFLEIRISVLFLLLFSCSVFNLTNFLLLVVLWKQLKSWKPMRGHLMMISLLTTNAVNTEKCSCIR